MLGQLKASGSAADGFDARTRARLERFADAFDDVSAEGLFAFAGPHEPDKRLRLAMDAALEALRAPARRASAKQAVDRFVQAAERRYSETFNVAHLIGMGAVARQSSSDRVRVFKALERAVVAVILWDQLGDEDRALLAGPWAEQVDDAAEAA